MTTNEKICVCCVFVMLALMVVQHLALNQVYKHAIEANALTQECIDLLHKLRPDIKP